MIIIFIFVTFWEHFVALWGHTGSTSVALWGHRGGTLDTGPAPVVVPLAIVCMLSHRACHRMVVSCCCSCCCRSHIGSQPLCFPLTVCNSQSLSTGVAPVVRLASRLRWEAQSSTNIWPNIWVTTQSSEAAKCCRPSRSRC